MIDVPRHVAETQRRRTPSERAAERSRRLATETVLLDITKTFGISFVPNLFAALERKPAYLEVAWELFKDEVDLEALDARTKHIVALAISTNRSGAYLIDVFPQTFSLSPVGSRRCEIILSMIGMFQTFSGYLSDMAAFHTPTTTRAGIVPRRTPRILRRPQ